MKINDFIEALTGEELSEWQKKLIAIGRRQGKNSLAKAMGEFESSTPEARKYFDSSLGRQHPLIIGECYKSTGFSNEIKKPIKSIDDLNKSKLHVAINKEINYV